MLCQVLIEQVLQAKAQGVAVDWVNVAESKALQDLQSNSLRRRYRTRKGPLKGAWEGVSAMAPAGGAVAAEAAVAVACSKVPEHRCVALP